MRPFFSLLTVLLSLFFLGMLVPGQAGMTAFTDRGKIDFDTAMGLLNPYGTWTKIGERWAFTPLDHAAPYTHGRWIYTEFGWTWLGSLPHSWLTEHYGYWKRGDDHLWAWYPGPDWLPQTVEIRAGPSGIGWRSAEVDRDGNFVESPSDRFTKTDEWSFVSLAQFAGPITPAVIAKGDAAERFLEESTDSIHSYLTYRQIDRPGPHPADFIALGDGGMFAPMTPEERQKAQRPAVKPVANSDAPQAAPLAADTQALNGDTRQVKYWITMSLPTRWTPPPADAKPNEIYLYRPDFYQDQDGIERRIALWLDPSVRASEALHLREALNHVAAVSTSSAAPVGTGAASNAPATPPRDPFASPLFDDSLHSDAPPASPKPPLSAAGAPIGTNTQPVPASPAQ